MAKRKKAEPVQGTLFGPDAPPDAYREHPVQAPEPAPPVPPRWDEGLTPPTPGELAALHAAHPGALLLFRHPNGSAFHGHDAGTAAGVLGLPLSGPAGAPRTGWAHGDFEGPVRKLLRAGCTVAVVERGEGLPPGHRLGAEPVVTPWAVVPEGEDAHDA